MSRMIKGAGLLGALSALMGSGRVKVSSHNQGPDIGGALRRLFKPRIRMRRLSRYEPHQSLRERERRLRQIAFGQLDGPEGFLPSATREAARKWMVSNYVRRAA